MLPLKTFQAGYCFYHMAVFSSPQRSAVLLVGSNTNLKDESISNLIWRLLSHPDALLSSSLEVILMGKEVIMMGMEMSDMFLHHQLTFLPLSIPTAQVPLICRNYLLLLGGHTFKTKLISSKNMQMQ